MSVELRIPTLLRPHTDNQSVIAAEGASLGEVLNDVSKTYPGLTSQLIGEDGELHKFLNVYVNDDDVRYTGKLETAVKEGDSITILPAVAGG